MGAGGGGVADGGVAAGRVSARGGSAVLDGVADAIVAGRAGAVFPVAGVAGPEARAEVAAVDAVGVGGGGAGRGTSVLDVAGPEGAFVAEVGSGRSGVVPS